MAAHSYPTAHPRDQNASNARRRMPRSTKVLLSAKARTDAQLPNRTRRFTVQFDDFRFRDIHNGTGFIDPVFAWSGEIHSGILRPHIQCRIHAVRRCADDLSPCGQIPLSSR